jgi:ribosomal protein S27E
MKITVSMKGSSFATNVPEDKAKDRFNQVVATLLSQAPSVTEDSADVEEKEVASVTVSAPVKVEVAPSPIPKGTLNTHATTAPTEATHSFFGRDPDVEGYLGFLYLKCPKCGNTRALCAKYPMKEFHCKSCGADTPLHHLTRMTMECDQCGKVWRYRTNAEDMELNHDCLNCGNTVYMEFKDNKEGYVTVR